KYSLLFFFFQAEDGIRDLIVTGVQTCALPISRDNASPPHSTLMRRSPNQSASTRNCQNDGVACITVARLLRINSFIRAASKISRSEERRVGKECRSRWSR